MEEDGLDVRVIDAATGERLLESPEVEEAWKAEGAVRKAAEDRAARAEERAAEAELARLRAELGKR